MRNTGQFVSLVTQRLFRVSTRKSNCSMINASHSPFLPHMLPRMVFFHPGIYNIVNAVWLKGRSRNAQRQMGTEECGVEAVYEMEMIIGSAISNLCICLSMTPQVRTHSYCFSVICYCKRIWSKTLQITLPWKHLSISGKQKRAPPHVDVTPVKTTARNCPTPTFYWVFFLSELKVHKHDSHLQWKHSFNSNTAIFFFPSCLSQAHFHHFTCAQELLSLQTGRILTFTEHKSVTIPKSKRLQKGRWEDLVLQDWCSKLIFTPLREH